MGQLIPGQQTEKLARFGDSCFLFIVKWRFWTWVMEFVIRLELASAKVLAAARRWPGGVGDGLQGSRGCPPLLRSPQTLCFGHQGGIDSAGIWNRAMNTNADRDMSIRLQ